MNRRIILILSIWCFSSMITVAQTPQARQKPADKSGAIDPQAMAAVNRMNDYLKTLKAFRINSEVSKDVLVDTNMKIQKSASNEISVQLPDRLYAHMAGDEQNLLGSGAPGVRRKFPQFPKSIAIAVMIIAVYLLWLLGSATAASVTAIVSIVMSTASFTAGGVPSLESAGGVFSGIPSFTSTTTPSATASTSAP